MNIIYDYQAFSLQERGGISRYFYELATRVANYDECQVKILAFGYVNKYLKKSKENFVVGLPVPTIPISSRAMSKLNFELSKGLSQINRQIYQSWIKRLSPSPDIVHETYYSSHRLATKQSKTVITVYDMISEKFCEFTGQKKSGDILSLKAASIQRADKIICISNNTKKDLLEFYNVDPEKISVVHLASNLEKIEDKRGQNFSQSTPYLLYVGSRHSYKNFQRLLQAYSLSNLQKEFQLVCFGGDPFARRELELMNEFHLREGQVIYVSGDDRKLAAFYSNASAFVYPSLYEGFGIPLLEAMSCDCPVVCSNTSSIPEVAGNAAEFVDPYDLESIAYGLKQVLFSTERTQELIHLGQERVKTFSWDACAKKTYSIYLSLV